MTLVRIVLACMLAITVLPGAARAAEVIESFNARIDVGRDGALSVTETIVVHAEGQEIRHGIYRNLPLQFRDERGRLRRVGFTLEAVNRDGRPEDHFTRSNDAGTRIYVGSQDVLVPPGRHTYELRYTTTRQLRFLSGHTELFWNVTGNEWIFPIETASATVHLPGNAAPVRWTAYTGPTGARGTDWQARLGPDQQLEFATTRPLGPGEGLSIVAEIPDGVVSPPGGLEALGYAISDYRRPLLAGLGLLGVLAFYLVAWDAVGRDPPRGLVIPRFHPPPGISPALAAYIHQWGWRGGWREFTATAVSLAVKGRLVFEGDASHPVLRLAGTDEPPGASTPKAAPATTGQDLSPSEAELLRWLEDNDGKVRIDRDHGTSVSAALGRFKGTVERDNRNRFFRQNLGHFIAGLALTGVAIALFARFGGLRDAEVGLLLGIVIAAGVAGTFLAGLVRRFLAGQRVRPVITAVIAVTALGWVIVTGGSFVLSQGGAQLAPGFARSILDAFVENSFPLALMTGFAILNGVFYYLLRAPTAAGRKVMDEIEGLRLYLQTAESARLNLRDAPELDTAHFERLLPYAIALGVEQPWAQAFEAAFARMHPDADVRTAYRPAWSNGSHWSSHGIARAATGMVAATQQSFATAVPPPSRSSSGFSGGGGSGGGGGGGGGGGW